MAAGIIARPTVRPARAGVIGRHGRAAAARPGATISLLGIPRDKAVTIRDYTNDLVFRA